MTKAGPGTLILSGDNLYTGATTVAAGTLLAENTTGSATGPGTVTVRAGATLGGTGTVAGRVTANSGVIVMAATNRPETLDPALLRPGPKTAESPAVPGRHRFPPA